MPEPGTRHDDGSAPPHKSTDECPLCGEPREQHVPGPPDPPGPDAACLLRDPIRRAPHRPTERVGVMPDDFVKLTEDRHQQALYRLAAVGQYLYDTMNGDAESDRDIPDPLPLISMECVREAQRQIDLAIKHGQRTRRECLGGHLDLVERPGRWVGADHA